MCARRLKPCAEGSHQERAKPYRAFPKDEAHKTNPIPYPPVNVDRRTSVPSMMPETPAVKEPVMGAKKQRIEGREELLALPPLTTPTKGTSDGDKKAGKKHVSRGLFLRLL